jgi:hypothetical protein
MEIEVSLPEMTVQNLNNRIYENELEVGTKAPVTLGISDTHDTSLVDVVGEGEVIEGNNLRITFLKDNEDHASELISGHTVVVPRGAGRVVKEGHINKIKAFRLIDFNIIEEGKSSYR